MTNTGYLEPADLDEFDKVTKGRRQLDCQIPSHIRQAGVGRAVGARLYASGLKIDPIFRGMNLSPKSARLKDWTTAPEPIR